MDRFCPICEKGKISIQDVSNKDWTLRRYDGTKVTAKLPERFEALCCDKCGEVFLSGNQTKEIDLLLQKVV